jgi:hypothetical protein
MSSKGHWIRGESQAAQSSAEHEDQIEQSARPIARRHYENLGLAPIFKDIEADLERRHTYRRSGRAQLRGLRVGNLAGEGESQVIILFAHASRIRRQVQGFRSGREPVANVRIG